MKKFITALFLLAIAGTATINACTNFLVTKGASADGSTMISYSADSYWLYGALYHYPAAKYPKGAKLQVNEWDTGKYLGEIDQVEETYNVVGNMNEWQLSIGETTFGGREELVDSTAIIDYGSLIYITLQRAKTAREAIYTMVTLVNQYGYCSEGESFSIADPNEVWIMEMIGKGPGRKGTAWVARMIPDGYICGHANQARITTFPQVSRKDKTVITSKNLKKIFDPQVTTAYAEDVISFAREKKYFTGKNDADFDFSDAFNPLDFSGIRICDARVWQFFNRMSPKQMKQYVSYINAETKERMPLWIKPDRKVNLDDMKISMRDHYEGTPWDMSKGMGTGGFQSVYRATPLFYKSGDGKEYFHERPVATQQTGFTFIAQMRDWLPREVGSILWFGVDDATCNLYLPIHSCITHIPKSLSEETANMLKFSWESAFWVNNWVANMVYYRYSDLYPEVRDRQKRMEFMFREQSAMVDKEAANFIKNGGRDQAIQMMQELAEVTAEKALVEWRELGEYLMVKYVDGVEKGMEKGQFMQNDKHIPGKVIRKGYSQEYIDNFLVKPDPNRFRVRTKEEMDKRK